MNTTTNNEAAVNLFNLTAIQIMRLAASGDIDAAEFGTRYIKYLALYARNDRTEAEQKGMVALLGMIRDDFSEPAFREHLMEVLG